MAFTNLEVINLMEFVVAYFIPSFIDLGAFNLAYLPIVAFILAYLPMVAFVSILIIKIILGIILLDLFIRNLVYSI